MYCEIQSVNLSVPHERQQSARRQAGVLQVFKSGVAGKVEKRVI